MPTKYISKRYFLTKFYNFLNKSPVGQHQRGFFLLRACLVIRSRALDSFLKLLKR